MVVVDFVSSNKKKKKKKENVKKIRLVNVESISITLLSPNGSMELFTATNVHSTFPQRIYSIGSSLDTLSSISLSQP